MKCLRAGRCGERIERRRWRMKRDERVAAVKILSVRRKAAQKFWAPQQGHRPLRGLQGVRYREVSPSHGFAVTAPFRQGGQGDGGTRIATASVRTGFAMTHYWKYGINPAGGQRRPPLRRVQEVRWGGPSGTPAPTEGYKGCGERADVGIGPYGSATRSSVNGPPGTPAPTKAQQEVR